MEDLDLVAVGRFRLKGLNKESNELMIVVFCVFRATLNP